MRIDIVRIDIDFDTGQYGGLIGPKPRDLASITADSSPNIVFGATAGFGAIVRAAIHGMRGFEFQIRHCIE